MKAATIKDIARECGVGVSTVSRALNNHPDINPETKARILEVIRESGFVPNDSARYLKRNESKSIALMVKGITNPFFTGMIRNMEAFAQPRGYAVILRHVGDEEDEVKAALSLVKERRLKGIIFLGGDFVHDTAQMEMLHVPYVFCTIGNSEEGSGGRTPWANVAVDDIAAGRMATEYLIQQGHRRIGIITECIDEPSVGQLRYRGYLEALRLHRIPYDESLVYEITEGRDHFSRANGYAGANSLLNAGTQMSALFCISDVLAFGACRAIREHGKRIPEDISVVGFDGIEEGDYFYPRLTTVCQPAEEMADVTVRLLFDMIAGKREPENIIMPAKLLIRESSGTGYRG